MLCRTIKRFIFPSSLLSFVKSRVAKMHAIVEEVMEPPYPRVAPTYKQGDDSNMIKLDLLMFLPLERSSKLQWTIEQLELVVEELDVSDVHLIEEKRKVDEAEHQDLVVDKDAENSTEELEGSSYDHSETGDEGKEEDDDYDDDYDDDGNGDDNGDDDDYDNDDDNDDDISGDEKKKKTTGKWAKPKRNCPVCGEGKTNMISHLQRVHKKSHADALNLSQSIRRTKENAKKSLQRLPCPVETCQKPVKRLDKHLKTVHKLKPTSPSFIRYNKRRKDMQEGCKKDGKKGTPQKTQTSKRRLVLDDRPFNVPSTASSPPHESTPSATHQSTPSPPHQSTPSPPHQSTLSPPHQSTPSPTDQSTLSPTHQSTPSHSPAIDYSSDDSLESSGGIPRLQISAEAASSEQPAMPKEVKRSAIAKDIERQPLLARFLDHLLSVEGGRRGLKPSKEAQWRVGRLLFEVDETVSNAKLLWNDEAMVHVRLTFIEGNHLLAKPKKVGTIRAYLTSLLMFYNFLLTRATSLANEFGLQENDFNMVKEFQGRVSNWMKSFTEESATRRTEVHRQDFQSLLTSTQIWNLLNSSVHKEFVERFEKLDDDPEKEFVDLRDYLITMVILQSAQRPGAVSNLTVKEFQAGEWDESTEVKQFVTLTNRHKTAGSGPASLSWDAQTYRCAQIYLQKLRPAVANEHSFLERHDQNEKEPLFFLTAKGNPLPSSQIGGRITKVAKLLDPSISGNVTGKRIRKSAVSRHRQLAESGESSGLSKDELARQMSHTTSTAEGHYAMRDTIKGCAKASNFIRQVAAKTPEKEKRSRKRNLDGSWKAVVRTKVSPEKPLRNLRSKNSEALTPPRRISPKQIIQPRRMSPKKKIWYRPNEVQALLKAVEAYRSGDNFGPDALWQAIQSNKACQNLNLTGKYTQTQLCNKAKKLYKET